MILWSDAGKVCQYYETTVFNEAITMLCTHLANLEKAIIESGVKETYRGAAWSKNCREWAYFDVVLDTDALRHRFSLPDCVQIHENKDARSGLERGFVCTLCHDAIIGLIAGPVFR